jgi:hypothetical protein
MALLFAAIVRIFPRTQRKRQARRMAGIMLLLVAWVAALRFQRESVWLGIVTGLASLPAILAYGSLPDDFPEANDPRRLSYKNYAPDRQTRSAHRICTHREPGRGAHGVIHAVYRVSVGPNPLRAP